MGIYPDNEESKYWHAFGTVSDFTLCGWATADGQRLEIRELNLVTCPLCIKIIKQANQYKTK